MIPVKSSYHPIDAAILWCGLASHETEILQVALSNPENVSKHFPQWPLLHLYTERIYDAIANNELPASYLGHPHIPSSTIERSYLSIRHSDLRVWISRYYPDERPSFLFPQKGDHSECVSLGVHLAQQAALNMAERELEKLRREFCAPIKKAGQKFNHNLAGWLPKNGSEEPSPASVGVYYLIIGSLLSVTLGKSPGGRVQSIYKSQADIVEAILAQFPKTPGLSKRTLDRKFAEARRHLAKVG